MSGLREVDVEGRGSHSNNVLDISTPSLGKTSDIHKIANTSKKLTLPPPPPPPPHVYPHVHLKQGGLKGYLNAETLERVPKSALLQDYGIYLFASIS